MNKIQILIEMDEHGVRVTGAIMDKGLAYGLLEAARDAIYEYHQKRMIVPAQSLDVLQKES